MKQKVVIYWARRDFRIADNPALSEAIKYSNNEDVPLLPLFILENYMTSGNPKYQFGYPSRFFLTKALPFFAKNFTNFSVVHGKAVETITEIAKHFDLTIFVNEDVHKDFYVQINKIKSLNVAVEVCEDMLSISKDTKTGAGKIYSVFTPFKNAVWKEFCSKKVLPNAKIDSFMPFKDSISKYCKIIQCNEEDLKKVFSNVRQFYADGVIYDIDEIINEKSVYDDWYFDEKSALKIFDSFLKNNISSYKKERDSLDSDGTSRMSVALAWGLVSSRMLKTKIQKHYDDDFLQISDNQKLEGPIHYISELIWREFYKYLFYHYPELMNVEFQEKFRGKIKWVDSKTAHYRFKKWIQGETGYPIVDAAMMELAKTGYMHNRSRMIVASVLTKNFGVDWKWGQEYFRAMLIDLDESSNNGGWQWGASVGADPKPIRIFNPYLQADNYDSKKLYQIKFLRKDYFDNPPAILVEHKEARADALFRYGLSTDQGTRDY